MFAVRLLGGGRGLRVSVSHRSLSMDWVGGYTALDAPQRCELIETQLLPRLFADTGKHSENEKGIPVAPAVSAFFHELSRHKGSITAAMRIREDIQDHLASTVRTAKTVDDMQKTRREQWQYLDKTMQSYLQTSLLCYDSMSLQRITFESSSGILLERVARGESVHRVRSLHELKRRLHDGRRCFGLFHSALPDDPLVFIHVALTTQLSPSLSSIVTDRSETSPTHAIFYSVNSPHNGLRGLDIASLLIKEVVANLQQTFPTIHTFSTLSPIPKFMKWLRNQSTAPTIALSVNQIEAIEHASKVFQQLVSPQKDFAVVDGSTALRRLDEILSSSQLQWISNAELSDILKPVLLRLAAQYLAMERITSKQGQVLPLDDVARFHLRNGAELHRINWLGNPSQNGIESSAAMMVNYLYDLSKVNDRATAFGQSQWSAPLGTAVQSILFPK